MTDSPASTVSLRQFQFTGRELSGPRLIILGAVHGNETCGTHAIERLQRELASGRLALVRGQLTLVPVTNPLAYERGAREGDRNLNRRLQPTEQPAEFEDRVANALCPLLAAHDVLLDLHSFHTPGEPFVMVGPPDNDGTLEPFSQARAEMALARHLGVGRIVEGWLDTYARGMAHRQARALAQGHCGLHVDPAYGVGTTEYMRSVGGYGVTLECGQHDDPQAPEVAWQAILQTLSLLGMVDRPLAPPRQDPLLMRLVDVSDRWHAGDHFTRDWQSFDAVSQGDTIGVRHDGQVVVAPHDGWVVFPNPLAEVDGEWFYFAQRSDRLIA
jgi:predicted deacylase